METVIKPGEHYHIYLVNDNDFNGEVLSVDENWVEFAVEHKKLGYYTFEIFPKSMIKRLLISNKSRKTYWVLDNSPQQRFAKFGATSLSDDEITFTRVKSNNVIFEDREDAIEYIKQLKSKENIVEKTYIVEREEDYSYEYF